MHTILMVLLANAGAMVFVVGVIIVFNSPRPPTPMQGVASAFAGVDFSDMPAKQSYAARDGTVLAYRAYPGDPKKVVVVIHGSSGTTASVHPLSRAINQTGATVYALAVRGHDCTGRSGDTDYVGQLDDDLVDFMKTLVRIDGETRTLFGFSSGGGFALRFAGGPHGAMFDRLVLVSPQFPHDAPTSRPNAGGWVSIALPRFVCLLILARLGISAFGGLPVLAFAISPDMKDVQTARYSFRMLRNFGPTDDYLDDVRRVPGPVRVFVGSDDEIHKADQYAPLLKPVRSDVKVTIIPGFGHMDVTIRPSALEVIAAAT